LISPLRETRASDISAPAEKQSRRYRVPLAEPDAQWTTANNAGPLRTHDRAQTASPDLGSSPIWITVLTREWGGEVAAPSTVRISGRVTTAAGYPIRNAVLTLHIGNPPFAAIGTFTGSMGTYFFDGLPPGQLYTIIVSAKRYRFNQWLQQISPTEDFDGINFIAIPQDEF
jgi:hypothetical protein